jgi:flagellar biosynthesis component FlhA
VRRKAHLEDQHVLITISPPLPFFFFFFFFLSYALAHSATEEKQNTQKTKRKTRKTNAENYEQAGRVGRQNNCTKSINLFSFLNLVTRTRIRGSEAKYPQK